MAKSVPSAFALPSLAELAPGKPVLASTWAAIAAAQHYVYGRQGAHVMNATFDPYWVSLDYASGGSAYHQVGSGTTNGMELDQVCSIFRFDRTEYNTTATAQGYRIAMNAYARNLSVRATLVRMDTEGGNTGSVTSFTSLVTTHSAADSEWDVDSEEYTPANASRGGSTANGLAYFLVYLEALVPASNTGALHHVGIRVSPITAAADIPRGA